jgi:uncharacterized protein (TIGR03084 family)
MDPIVEALADQHAELAGLVAAADETALDGPSKCAGWTVADVLLHLAQSDELAIASVQDRFDEVLGELLAGAPTPTGGSVDGVIDAMVAAQRGAPGPAVVERWTLAAAELVTVLDASDLRSRVTWVAGEVSARTLATTRLSETWIHTVDVAAPLGGVAVPSDRLRQIARLAWRTLPYAFAKAERDLSGPVAFELTAPDGSTWVFAPDGDATAISTTITGDATELCLVAARRLDPAEAGTLHGEGPDADAVLELVRTYA